MSAITEPASSPFLQMVAERYERRGYDVTFGPSPSTLPDTLKDEQLDAVAIRGDDRVALRVLSARRTPTHARIKDLARQVAATPGWRFEVLYTSDASENEAPLPILDRPRIDGDLRAAQDMAPQSGRAGLLLSWAALEAAVRASDVLDEPGATQPLSPRKLVETLESMGLVSAEEAARLRPIADLRTAVAHGDLDREPSARDVEEVAGIGRRVLEPMAA